MVLVLVGMLTFLGQNVKLGHYLSLYVILIKIFYCVPQIQSSYAIWSDLTIISWISIL